MDKGPSQAIWAWFYPYHALKVVGFSDSGPTPPSSFRTRKNGFFFFTGFIKLGPLVKMLDFQA